MQSPCRAVGDGQNTVDCHTNRGGGSLPPRNASLPGPWMVPSDVTEPCDHEHNMTYPKGVQILVIRGNQDILLGKWCGGELEGRYTGLLGAWEPGERPEAAAVRVARALCGLQVDPERLEPRALLDFIEVDQATGDLGSPLAELQFLYRVGGSAPLAGLDMAGNDVIVPEWIALDRVPYDQMPADDALWYPPVLLEGGDLLRGSFTFRGQQLLEHHLERVSSVELQELIAAA